MKQFLKNIILFFLLYTGLSFVISLCVPYHWGNPWYSVKARYLEKNNHKAFNTFFFGSSRVYRQVDPFLFDSLAQEITNEEIHSFNLGAPATFAPQTYFLYEQFLNSPLSKNAKYCFLELTDVSPIGKRSMHQEKTNYWLGMSGLSFAIKSIVADQTKSKTYRATQCMRYFFSYIENVLHLGHFSRQLTTTNVYEEDYLGPYNNGYLPYEYEYKTTKNPTLKKALFRRMKVLEKEPERLGLRRTRIQNAYNASSDSYYDRANRKRILELIERSRKKGIELIIFFISPRPMHVNKVNIVNLSRKIPKANLIDLCYPVRYPDLYAVENAFDLGHLNTKGSGLLTSYLAEEFSHLQLQKKE